MQATPSIRSPGSPANPPAPWTGCTGSEGAGTPPGSAKARERPGDTSREIEKKEQFREEALQHLDDLLGLALRLTGGDEARSEDLVQTTMLRAYRFWDRYETGTDCRAWLRTILRNAFTNGYRKRTRAPDKVEYEKVSERSRWEALQVRGPEETYFFRHLDEEVARAIEELPEAFRVPVVLCDLEDLTYEEIAGELGIPVGTVKSRIHRGRRRLEVSLRRYAREIDFLS